MQRTGEVDDQQAFARALRWPPPFRPIKGHRDRDGLAYQACCHPGCMSFSADTEGGHEPSKAVRWACPLHSDEGDFTPWQEPVRLDALGLPDISIEAERHYEDSYERAVREGTQRTEERAVEGERLRELEERHRATLTAPPGFGG
jgi:hypothetical protein